MLDWSLLSVETYVVTGVENKKFPLGARLPTWILAQKMALELALFLRLLFETQLRFFPLLRGKGSRNKILSYHAISEVYR